MKRAFISLAFLLNLFTNANAQGEQNLWTFGDVGLDFNGSTPVAYNNNLFPAYEGTATICDATGQMLFYTNGFWVWNRNHEIMPELTGGISGYTSVISPTIGYPPLMPWNGAYATQATAISGVPFHNNLYYLFSLSTSGNLYYSMIDMNLNGGLGGIVSGKKSILLATGLGEKMTVVKGCNNIWLLTRSRSANQYKAYEINDAGLVTTPVISNCGNLPLSWYRCGVIKFSPDGQKMAAACNEANNNKGGLEIYDFDMATGLLSNAAILDSSSTQGYYYGTCFSPDNSKLYATTSSFSYAGSFYPGKVRQFDMSLPSMAAIAASNTLVFTSSIGALANLGDLKRANDGRIYFGSGSISMHCIDNPNLAGLACNPLANAMLFPGGVTYRGLPNDIAILHATDTIFVNKNEYACFKDSLVLTAGFGKRYIWDDGSTQRDRTVRTDGLYIVRYYNSNCDFQIDSIAVRFIELPSLSPVSYSCPGGRQGGLYVRPKPDDTTSFTYTWKDANGTPLRQHVSNWGDTLLFADTGKYYVQITTPSGCDTTLEAKVLPLPVPQASFEVDSIVCAGVPVHFTNTSIAPLWHWYFGNGNFSENKHPSYAYTQRGQYSVALVVTNIEGCSDTMFKDISVKDLDIKLSSNTSLAEYGELVYLRSSADEPYSVNSWSPSSLFADQSALNQQVSMDTTRTFTITGVSEFGCVSNASVTVDVKPVVVMPTAFSPNGDGLNDYFRPLSSGYIFVRFFEIFNRYGELIFSANGQSALQGWDGSFKSRPMPLGVYYYHINIEVNGKGTIQLKGDVSLVR